MYLRFLASDKFHTLCIIRAGRHDEPQHLSHRHSSDRRSSDGTKRRSKPEKFLLRREERGNGGREGARGRWEEREEGKMFLWLAGNLIGAGRWNYRGRETWPRQSAKLNRTVLMTASVALSGSRHDKSRCSHDERKEIIPIENNIPRRNFIVCRCTGDKNG